jgi:hypothetical protein
MIKTDKVSEQDCKDTPARIAEHPDACGVFTFHSMRPEQQEESLYNPDYQRIRGLRREFCRLNGSNPWTQFADTAAR